MDDTWEQLTAALDELDLVRAQIREVRGEERTARFYRLVRTIKAPLSGQSAVMHQADVIELSGGWVLVHWTFAPKSLSLFHPVEPRTALSIARAALCPTSEYQLEVGDIALRAHNVGKKGNRVVLPLTAKELDVVRELRSGKANKEIGTALGLEKSTIKNRMSTIMKKLGPEVSDRLQVVVATAGWNIDEPTDEEDL